MAITLSHITIGLHLLQPFTTSYTPRDMTTNFISQVNTLEVLVYISSMDSGTLYQLRNLINRRVLMRLTPETRWAVRTTHHAHQGLQFQSASHTMASMATDAIQHMKVPALRGKFGSILHKTTASPLGQAVAKIPKTNVGPSLSSWMEQLPTNNGQC